MSKIIAVVGMCGSGKSIASDYFEKLGFQKVYFGGVTMDQLKKQNMKITPENEKLMRENLRKKYGMGAFAYLLIPTIEEYAKLGNVVLDGLYSWDEYIILKEKFKEDLIMLAIVEDKKLRYQRLEIREIRPFNPVQAKERDIAEIENLAKGGPIAFADYYILNNETKEKYIEKLEQFTKEVLS